MWNHWDLKVKQYAMKYMRILLDFLNHSLHTQVSKNGNSNLHNLGLSYFYLQPFN